MRTPPRCRLYGTAMALPQCSLSYTTVDGFEVVEVDTGPLKLAMLPQLGGKITSLRDTRTGREWLWRHPRLPYRQTAPGASYVLEADTGGWDECFPSVAACTYPSAPWRGATIADHGELWSQAPELTVVESSGGVMLRTQWQGVALPYLFERSVTLTAGSATVRSDYIVYNQADDPMPYIWCIHPLLAIEPGMELRFPADARFNRYAALPDDLLPQAADLRFPLTVEGGGQALDLARLPDRSAGIALKLWSDPLRTGWARLGAADGALQLRWDTTQLPQVAFWLNLGGGAADGGAPLYNLGLEPCIGAQDSLAEAVGVYETFGTVPARGTYAWHLEFELEASARTT